MTPIIKRFEESSFFFFFSSVTDVPPPDTDDLVSETAPVAQETVSQTALPGDTQTTLPVETASLTESGALVSAPAPEAASSPNTQRLSESLEEELASNTDIYFVSMSLIVGRSIKLSIWIWASTAVMFKSFIRNCFGGGLIYSSVMLSY